MEDLRLPRLGDDLLRDMVEYVAFRNCLDLDNVVLKPIGYTLENSSRVPSETCSAWSPFAKTHLARTFPPTLRLLVAQHVTGNLSLRAPSIIPIPITHVILLFIKPPIVLFGTATGAGSGSASIHDRLAVRLLRARQVSGRGLCLDGQGRGGATIGRIRR